MRDIVPQLRSGGNERATAAEDDLRVVYVTVRFPGRGEEFLEPEIEHLRDLCPVDVIPLRPRRRTPLRGFPSRTDVLVSAAREVLRRPRHVVRAVSAALRLRPTSEFIRNLLVVPKALWLASIVDQSTHLHAAWATTPATACMITSAVTGQPWSFSAHRHDIEAANNLRAKLNSARFVRTISERGRSELIAKVPSQADKVKVIRLGVEIPDSPAPLRRDETLVVFCAAAMVPLKNHLTMVRALNLTEDVRLLCAGDGPERARVRRLAQDLGVTDRLEFLGHLDHEQVLSLLASGDIHVVTLASLIEGVPVSLMEAMSYGIPVVATDVGAVDELVVPGTGLLIEDPTDAEGLAAAWCEVGSWDRRVTAALTRAAIAEQYEISSCARRLADLVMASSG